MAQDRKPLVIREPPAWVMDDVGIVACFSSLLNDGKNIDNCIMSFARKTWRDPGHVLMMRSE